MLSNNPITIRHGPTLPQINGHTWRDWQSTGDTIASGHSTSSFLRAVQYISTIISAFDVNGTPVGGPEITKLQKDWAAKSAALNVRDTDTVLAHLHEFLFEEQKFNGLKSDCFGFENHRIDTVIAKKSGSPIMLSVIYMALGRDAWLDVHGGQLPDGFCCWVKDRGSYRMVDPFVSGRMYTKSETYDRVLQANNPERFNTNFEKRLSHLDTVTSLCQSLLRYCADVGELDLLGKVLSFAIALHPNKPLLYHNLAEVLPKQERNKEAASVLKTFILRSEKSVSSSEVLYARELLRGPLKDD